MKYIPSHQRTFSLWLAYEFEYQYIYSLRWLRHFLERLGPIHTLSTWQEAFQGYDASSLESILSEGWQPASQPYAAKMEKRLAAFVESHYPVAGVAAAEARDLIDRMPPL